MQANDKAPNQINHSQRAKNRRALAEEMAEKYKAGMTLKELGDFYGFSRERARQLMTWELGITHKDGGKHKRATEKQKAQEERARIRHAAKWGMSIEQRQTLRDMDPDYSQTPICKFVQQRNNAKRRNIDWQLTLGEWWQIWEASGKWDERGRGSGYVMARHGDTGPYAVGNVKVINGRENQSEYIRRHWKQVRSGDKPHPKTQSGESFAGRYRELEVGDAIDIPITTRLPVYAQNHALQIGRSLGWKFRTRTSGGVLTVTRLQ